MPERTAVRPVATPGADALAAFALLAVWTAAHLGHLWGTWPYDLAAVYIAGHFWDAGQLSLVYAAPPHFFGGPAPEWAATIDTLGGAGEGAFPYVYPPLWAALMAPLTRVMSAHSFFNLAYLVQLPLLAACIPLARRIAGRPVAAWIWALTGILLLQGTTPFYAATNQNQPSILVTFLVLLAAERSLAASPRAAGLALALAAALKITPVVFVLLFVLRRDWRALGWCLLCGAAFLVANLWLAGPAANRAYLAALGATGGASLVSAINISAKALIDFWISLATSTLVYATDNMYIVELPAGLRRLSSLASLVLGAGLAVHGLIAARALPERARMVASLLTLSVVLFLFGPLGWLHYYLLPLALLPGLLAFAPPRKALAAALPAVIGANIVSFPLLLDLSPAWSVAISAAGWIASLLAIARLSRGATTPGAAVQPF
ncbi:MAG: DUF2029 domain-containing protein [Proteobacteria bacterium]|nr:DUF2029 domain-containing protein [Pseudomonadota bacterium]